MVTLFCVSCSTHIIIPHMQFWMIFHMMAVVYVDLSLSVCRKCTMKYDLSWVESKISLSNICFKSTLKYCVMLWTHHCMWILHLSSSWSNSEQKTLTHRVLSPGLIFTSIHSYIFEMLHGFLSSSIFISQTHTFWYAKHKVHPKIRLELISVSHLSCSRFHLKHYSVVILLWLSSYNNGLLKTLYLSPDAWQTI